MYLKSIMFDNPISHYLMSKRQNHMKMSLSFTSSPSISSTWSMSIFWLCFESEWQVHVHFWIQTPTPNKVAIWHHNFNTTMKSVSLVHVSFSIAEQYELKYPFDQVWTVNIDNYSFHTEYLLNNIKVLFSSSSSFL